MQKTLTTVGLFAGIGGLERGLARAGHRCIALVEKDEAARDILGARFGQVPLTSDVRDLTALPRADLVAAGFPCADLSQAGRTNGIDGSQSGLVKHLFRLLQERSTCPEWLVLENVPFMLHLDRGRAMRYLIRSLEDCGYRWAYRVVNTQAFGLPQRRRRILIAAARSSDPRRVLLADDAGAPKRVRKPAAFGFYWTEGNSGLGWAVDAVPPLKTGSALTIPSPPAMWFPRTGQFGCPEIRDAERLQGFPRNWTRPPGRKIRDGHRWRLVGNAVSVPVASWLGRRLSEPGEYDDAGDDELGGGATLPSAAWGESGRLFRSAASEWPVRTRYTALKDFLLFPIIPLSERAAAGFLTRLRASTLRLEDGFLTALEMYVERVRGDRGCTCTSPRGDRTVAT